MLKKVIIQQEFSWAQQMGDSEEGNIRHMTTSGTEPPKKWREKQKK